MHRLQDPRRNPREAARLSQAVAGAGVPPAIPHRPRCRGRFAPSPTGPLHFGSVVAALGSWLDARSRGGEWLVRIEDIDPPRERPGAAAAILAALEALGLVWDGPVVRQSTRAAAHAEALRALAARGAAFPCGCTRRETAGGPYPGRCREGLPAGRVARALRVRVDETPVVFVDRLQGRIAARLTDTCGDYVVRRADGLSAYHLAVTVDDAWQGITDVVRGADLLRETAPQIHLQGLLDLPTPAYAHLPVALDAAGLKLSKQNHAAPIDIRSAPNVLVAALRFLEQAPPAGLEHATPEVILAWAVPHWLPERLRGMHARPAP